MGLKTLINPFSYTWNHLESPTLYVPIIVIACSTKVVEHASFFMLFFSLDYPICLFEDVSGCAGCPHTASWYCPYTLWVLLCMVWACNVGRSQGQTGMHKNMSPKCVCVWPQEKRWIGSKAKPPCIIT
jgi:hypothetical protein